MNEYAPKEQAGGKGRGEKMGSEKPSVRSRSLVAGAGAGWVMPGRGRSAVTPPAPCPAGTGSKAEPSEMVWVQEKV